MIGAPLLCFGSKLIQTGLLGFFPSKLGFFHHNAAKYTESLQGAILPIFAQLHSAACQCACAQGGLGSTFRQKSEKTPPKLPQLLPICTIMSPTAPAQPIFLFFCWEISHNTPQHLPVFFSPFFCYFFFFNPLYQHFGHFSFGDFFWFMAISLRKWTQFLPYHGPGLPGPSVQVS